MVQPAKNVLFVSDLSVHMKQVFEHAATIAACMDADITILHVMEEDPGAEKRVRMAFGEQLYKDLKTEQKDGARNILIGKNLDALKIRQAMAVFFEDTVKEKTEGNNNSLIKKILVAEGRTIADEILATAEEEDCDMIAMGCRQQGLLAEHMGDKLVRKILRRSPMPVFVVPFTE